MHLPDPYTELEARWPRVKVRIRRDLGSDAGRTVWLPNGQAEIHLAHDLSRVQRRCVLAHECRHLERGAPEPADKHADEQATLAETARWLIPDLAVFADLLTSQDVATVAMELDVVPSIVYDRLDGMTRTEFDQFTAAMTVAA